MRHLIVPAAVIVTIWIVGWMFDAAADTDAEESAVPEGSEAAAGTAPGGEVDGPDPDAGVDGGDGCAPACGEGFTCVVGICISKCNPPCRVDEFCTGHGECVEKFPRALEAAPESGEFAPNLPEYAGGGYIDEPEGGESPPQTPSLAWFGARLGGGFAAAVGDVWRNDEVDDYGATKTGNVAFGGWFDFHYYFVPHLALVTGFGMLNRGIKKQSHLEDVSTQDTIIYAEIPVGAKFYMSNVQVGAALSLDIGVYATTRTQFGSLSGTTTWGREAWRGHRRTNLGAKLFAGYAFPSDQILVVPGMEVSMHVLNDLDMTDADGRALASRYLNVFVTIGVVRAR